MTFVLAGAVGLGATGWGANRAIAPTPSDLGAQVGASSPGAAARLAHARALAPDVEIRDPEANMQARHEAMQRARQERAAEAKRQAERRATRLRVQRERQARRAAAATAHAAAIAKQAHDNPDVTTPFTLATFNALGASHTNGKHPERKGWDDSTTRIKRAVALFRDRGLDVVGMQEFQASQRAAFARYGGSTFGVYAPSDNGVVWRKSRFDLVSQTVLAVPYFGGRMAPQAVVRLRSRDSGQEIIVISVHNPADVHGHAQQWRDQATSIEADYVARLRAEADPVPVFLVGDMNDRHRFYCDITTNGHLHFPGDATDTPSQASVAGSPANGSTAEGSMASTCQPPAYNGIDWILASTGVTTSGFNVDWSTTRGGARMTDHPLVTMHVGR